MSRMNPRGAVLVALTIFTTTAQDKQTASSQPTVVFVCEHGAAKSVVAAAWFDKLATERHLPFQAIARGTTPQEDFAQSAVAGLKRDGVAFPWNDKPKALTAREASTAARVVAFCPLPAHLKPAGAEIFDVPGPGDGYDQSRDAILAHVREVLDGLQKKPPPPRP